jgi:hypothetical protein
LCLSDLEVCLKFASPPLLRRQKGISLVADAGQ